ncbi:MAG: hypothetical protein J3K34DRAFT_527448 [Monoraphidium minutum]|nr:MAG: hypothetical protein J3K34DRAFT_527448 [Monoraphidium minutum]
MRRRRAGPRRPRPRRRRTRPPARGPTSPRRRPRACRARQTRRPGRRGAARCRPATACAAAAAPPLPAPCCRAGRSPLGAGLISGPIYYSASLEREQQGRRRSQHGRLCRPCEFEVYAGMMFVTARAPAGTCVTFITHAVHAGWLAALLPGLRLGAGLPHSPGGVWPAASGGGGGGGGGSGTLQPVREEEAREAVLAAACDALALPLPPPPGAAAAGGAGGAGGACGAGGEEDEITACPAPRRLLVFNLFCLEAFHIAEALALPCAAAHPYLIPYSCPAAFERRFASAHPALHAVLRAADGNEEGRTGWAEVRHWMWPLFTERWGAWRQERLGLAAVPLLGAGGGSVTPPAVPLLYGFSELVVARPGHWPPSVHATGFWLQAHVREAHPELAAGWQLPAGLQRFLESDADSTLGLDGCGAGGAKAGAAGAGAPVVIDFGSMGLLGLLPPPGALLGVLLAALEAAGMRAVLLGTTAAALAAGAPQAVAPLQFDQPFWAGRLEHLGLSPPPLDAAAAAAGEVAARLLQAAGSRDIRRRCSEMAASLREPGERGVDVAAAMLLAMMMGGGCGPAAGLPSAPER